MPAKRIPALFDSAFWPERGAVASYGPDFYESGRQAARLVDKILKGQPPAEIPVEVNSKLEFAINRKVAQAIGLTLTPGGVVSGQSHHPLILSMQNGAATRVYVSSSGGCQPTCTQRRRASTMTG